MKCEVCQCELPDGASFCPECGSMQEQRFEKQFEESIKKENTNNTYNSNSYNQVNPYMSNSISDTYGRQGIPPLTFEEGMSRREFYQLYQPDKLKRYSDIWMAILFLSIVSSFCLIAFFQMYAIVIDLIFVGVIMIGYYLTRNKAFVYVLLVEQFLVSIISLFSRKGSGGFFIIIVSSVLINEIKKFEIYYKEYLLTGHVSSLNECFRRATPAKTSKVLIVIVSILSILIIGLCYTVSNYIQLLMQ